ncbi:Alpha/beta hydrolase family protein [compost metagenome]
MDVQKPYILVGHSMGGQYIRVFQSLFPDDVAGLVLVDGTVDTFSTDIVPEFDPILQELYPASFNDPLLGLFSDVEASSTQARAARPMLRNVPLTVLCPEYQIGPMSPPEDHELLPLTNPEVTDAKWKQLQEGLVSESNFGKFVYVKESAHEINIYKPEVITKEIKLMFNKVK